MIKGQKIIIVIPAYNAENTLAKTYNDIPPGIADEIVLTNDGSSDRTAEIAEKLGMLTFSHYKNKGYGAAMKTCFSEALKLNPDIIVVLHSDNQYDPKLTGKMARIIAEQDFDVVMASRMLDKNVFKAMPFYRYAANKILTLIQNIVFGLKLSEYQSGYRAYSADVLRKVSFIKNSDDFVFDNELLAKIIFHKFKVTEIECPARYLPENSSINIPKSFKYFFEVTKVCLKYRFNKIK